MASFLGEHLYESRADSEGKVPYSPGSTAQRIGANEIARDKPTWAQFGISKQRHLPNLTYLIYRLANYPQLGSA